MTTKAEQAERQEAIKALLEDYHLKPGDTLYTQVLHVSRSGMYRAIGVYIAYLEDGKAKISDISWRVAKCGVGKFDRNHGGVGMSGCGMDMCFSTIYNLGRTLWPNGFKTWKGYWRNEPMDFEPDGGYALKHSDL